LDPRAILCVACRSSTTTVYLSGVKKIGIPP